MGRGKSKKKFDIPAPGMASLDDDDDAPVITSKPRKSKKKLDLDIPAPGMADLEDESPVEEPHEEVVDETDPQPKRTKTPKAPVENYPAGEYWRMDGKQFDISLQDAKESNKYQSFEETDSLADAKDIANNAAFEEGRVVIVWDRKLGGPCYRIDPNAPLEEEEEPKKKGKK
jgi:hypothetical protein